ncbi:hypothetical protein L3081_16385 [Colwellia sp. MSW7]|jgi:hypothetical protein|uniref:Uncharacterized protein n=1 Tax=Colwellia maritima TaxID=2912588 RepID=A0ABS9X356_9GAMM|nr:hypothetical protein [Colwellia maritima]MCI2284677.1 hypothetical protein [Colwellia maritima]
MVNDDDFLDDIDAEDDTEDQEDDLESLEVAGKNSKEQAQKNILARKRIDELMEMRRLKELFDDEDDW